MPPLHPDLAEPEFRALGYQIVDLLSDLYSNIESAPAFPASAPAQVEALFDAPPPEHAEAIDVLLRDWRERIVPHSSLQGSPRWFGFVNGSGTQIGALADAMASAINPNCGGWRASPAATEIERRTVRWLSELIGYHPDAGGVFVSGGTMANAAALRVALRAKAGWDLNAGGLQQRDGSKPMTVYLADHETHVSLIRSVDLLGLGRNALRAIPSGADFRIDCDALERQIRADAATMQPFVIVGNVGSINVGAIDDINALADIAQRHGLWLHLDGACGALGGMLPELATHFEGLARADSVSFDAHKWFGAPYEAGCLLVRDAEALRRAFTMHANYLLPAAANEHDEGLNYFEYGPQLSRSWRAFKVWMTLRYYGAEGMRTFFRQTIACARHLHQRVVASPDFEVVQPEPLLYIYAFRWAPPELRGDDVRLDQLNQRIADELQRRRIAFAMTTRIRGRVTQRLSICSHRTTIADIDATFDAMQSIGDELLNRR